MIKLEYPYPRFKGAHCEQRTKAKKRSEEKASKDNEGEESF
jgi:hypothetical protein